MVAPQAITLVCASGSSASLPQNKADGNLGNLVKAIIPDTPQESTEPGSIFRSATAANVAPAVFCAVESLNVSVSHKNKSKVTPNRFCLTPSIYRRSPIVPTKIDGMPIVTRWQPGASTGSPPIVQDSRDGMPIVTTGQLMLD